MNDLYLKNETKSALKDLIAICEGLGFLSKEGCPQPDTTEALDEFHRASALVSNLMALTYTLNERAKPDGVPIL